MLVIVNLEGKMNEPIFGSLFYVSLEYRGRDKVQ